MWFPALALALVGVLMCWRRAYRELPFFFIYVVYALLSGGMRYVALPMMGSDVYFYVYWISELAASLPVALALYEIFLRRLFPGFHKIRFYRYLFLFTAVSILLLTILVASQSSDKRAAFVRASGHADLVRTIVLVFFVGLMVFMGRQWRRYDFGIALGFGIQAAVALVDTAVRFQYSTTPPILTTVDVIVYDITCLIWLITFLKPDQAPPQVPPAHLSPEALQEAKKWEESLKGFLADKH